MNFFKEVSKAFTDNPLNAILTTVVYVAVACIILLGIFADLTSTQLSFPWWVAITIAASTIATVVTLYLARDRSS